MNCPGCGAPDDQGCYKNCPEIRRVTVKKLIMCQGLPGSGKTTWAKDQVQAARLGAEPLSVAKVARINKDDIRRELENGGWKWSKDGEKLVEQIRDSQINVAFQSGVETVISDDTNYAPKHEARFRVLAAQNGATFEIKTFDTPLKECIRRDAARIGKARVGEEVIRRMANHNNVYDPTILNPYVAPDAMSAILCDIDGTLAKGIGVTRGPYEEDKVLSDTVNEPVRTLIEMAYRFMGWQIVYISGRSEKARGLTAEWFRMHHIPPGPLFMRTAGDTRADWMVKGELFSEHVRNRYRVRFVLDDRDSVVAYWRKIGLTCFQVAPGDF